MKAVTKIFFLLTALIFLYPVEILKADNKISGSSSEKKLEVGEELVYVVKYSVMRLGEIKIRVTDKKEIGGKGYYSAIADIDSYPSIPFVHLHQVYETTMTPDFYSTFFRGLIKHDDYTSYTEYFFDYKHSKVRVREGKVNEKEPWIDTTGNIDKEYQDGLSILFYARMNSGKRKKEEVPVFMNEKKVTTDIDFDGEREGVSIDAVDYDVDCVHLEGEANFISIFGLTGHFEGWFSNDEAAIPIKAKMNVILGNITLELKSWKRNGWQPPKYRD